MNKWRFIFLVMALGLGGCAPGSQGGDSYYGGDDTYYGQGQGAQRLLLREFNRSEYERLERYLQSNRKGHLTLVESGGRYRDYDLRTREDPQRVKDWLRRMVTDVGVAADVYYDDGIFTVMHQENQSRHDQEIRQYSFLFLGFSDREQSQMRRLLERNNQISEVRVDHDGSRSVRYTCRSGMNPNQMELALQQALWEMNLTGDVAVNDGRRAFTIERQHAGRAAQPPRVQENAEREVNAGRVAPPPPTRRVPVESPRDPGVRRGQADHGKDPQIAKPPVRVAEQEEGKKPDRHEVNEGNKKPGSSVQIRFVQFGASEAEQVMHTIQKQSGGKVEEVSSQNRVQEYRLQGRESPQQVQKGITEYLREVNTKAEVDVRGNGIVVKKYRDVEKEKEKEKQERNKKN